MAKGQAGLHSLAGDYEQTLIAGSDECGVGVLPKIQRRVPSQGLGLGGKEAAPIPTLHAKRQQNVSC
jgi:hypothetical protein